ncbi:pentatricopeptide repeat (PPR) superfamily protein [Actinidia rufa]|uniref:Pentatricopeptide repeat (PPR) superfamily protein n=1 Tax=Actinidia rufa TaxID=165716 RepID=A0A7J0EC97_9ERIC|nr:pentatricopeptide repeat (PPR) superfamily protein [Actinidia rufa]
MSERTVVSWNAMISGYSKWGRLSEALTLVSSMHRSHMRLNETTFSTVLSVCARLRSLHDGKQVHGLVLKSGSESSKLVGSALLYFYANCFEIKEAKQVFDLLHEGNELLWSLMLVGVRMGVRRLWSCFLVMRETGEVPPNEFTFDCVLRACGRVGECVKAMDDAKRVYDRLVNPCLNASNALIEGLILMGKVDEAETIFDGLTEKNSVTYNLMIKGYSLSGRVDDSERTGTVGREDDDEEDLETFGSEEGSWL